MSGPIFISYRREESRWSAGRLYDRLTRHFDRKQVFMDIDGIALGADFVKAIQKKVSECDVLIAVIGERWLTSEDGRGGRRLDNPEDFVRMEIATALKRDIRVIPVLVDGVVMPPSTDLPDDLKPLVRRNALLVRDTGFDDDCRRLVAAIKQAQAEGPQKAPGRMQARTKWLLAVVLALIAGVGLIWFAVHKEPPGVLLTPTPTTEGGANAAYIRGNAYYDKKEYDEAISDYTEAIRLKPDYADAYFKRGNAYYDKKEYDKAISDFTEAIRLKPDYADAYFKRGNAYYDKKEYDKAISDYTEAIRLDPNYVKAYNNRGNAYKIQGKLDKAEADFAKGAELKKAGH
jgi:Tfp pilus assembly protein PilF